MLPSKKKEKESMPPPCLAIVPFVKKRSLISLLKNGQSHDPDSAIITADDKENADGRTAMTPPLRGGGDGRRRPSSMQPIILPDALLPIVLSYCDAETLCRVAAVNQTWYHVANADVLWERLCRHDYCLSAYQIQPPPCPVKKLYQKVHASLRAIWRESSSSSWRNHTSVGQSLSSRGYLTIRVSSSTSSSSLS